MSGNTPLVIVLREALTLDEHRRASGDHGNPRSKKEIRRDVRARIQHINDFLKDALARDGSTPPHEHAIVFDEAQRAWDQAQGQKKFQRSASEPALLLELMGRHRTWCALICLIGGGQEINSGEDGVKGWGDALATIPKEQRAAWSVYGPEDVFSGGTSAGGIALGSLPDGIQLAREPHLQLQVPMRSYRAPSVSAWVRAVLAGDSKSAQVMAATFGRYPVKITRSLDAARAWLEQNGRGHRRYGLVASSGARRLRAAGIGVTLNATDGNSIAHWYLCERGDLRSSYAMEVTANEYTCQGLELDYIGVCWGGDMIRGPSGSGWTYRRLRGARWEFVRDAQRVRFIENSYRVLLTRAREGMVIWIPRGERSDPTRDPSVFDRVASFLVDCGAAAISA